MPRRSHLDKQPVGLAQLAHVDSLVTEQTRQLGTLLENKRLDASGSRSVDKLKRAVDLCFDRGLATGAVKRDEYLRSRKVGLQLPQTRPALPPKLNRLFRHAARFLPPTGAQIGPCQVRQVDRLSLQPGATAARELERPLDDVDRLLPLLVVEVRVAQRRQRERDHEGTAELLADLEGLPRPRVRPLQVAGIKGIEDGPPESPGQVLELIVLAG